MFNRFRRIAAAAAAVVALGAGGAAWADTSAAASAAPAAVPHCTYGHLAVWVYADSGDTVGGVTSYKLEFTNIGQRTCTLTGFPAVTATTLHRVALGVPAARQYGVPAETIVLRAGATAHSLLGYFSGRVTASCRPESGGFLAVLAPGAGNVKRAYFPLPVCTTGRVDLAVKRVTTGF